MTDEFSGYENLGPPMLRYSQRHGWHVAREPRLSKSSEDTRSQRSSSFRSNSTARPPPSILSNPDVPIDRQSSYADYLYTERPSTRSSTDVGSGGDGEMLRLSFRDKVAMSPAQLQSNETFLTKLILQLLFATSLLTHFLFQILSNRKQQPHTTSQPITKLEFQNSNFFPQTPTDQRPPPHSYHQLNVNHDMAIANPVSFHNNPIDDKTHTQPNPVYGQYVNDRVLYGDASKDLPVQQGHSYVNGQQIQKAVSNLQYTDKHDDDVYVPSDEPQPVSRPKVVGPPVAKKPSLLKKAFFNPPPSTEAPVQKESSEKRESNSTPVFTVKFNDDFQPEVYTQNARHRPESQASSTSSNVRLSKTLRFLEPGRNPKKEIVDTTEEEVVYQYPDAEPEIITVTKSEKSLMPIIRTSMRSSAMTPIKESNFMKEKSPNTTQQRPRQLEVNADYERRVYQPKAPNGSRVRKQKYSRKAIDKKSPNTVWRVEKETHFFPIELLPTDSEPRNQHQSTPQNDMRDFPRTDSEPRRQYQSSVPSYIRGPSQYVKQPVRQKDRRLQYTPAAPSVLRPNETKQHDIILQPAPMKIENTKKLTEHRNVALIMAVVSMFFGVLIFSIPALVCACREPPKAKLKTYRTAIILACLGIICGVGWIIAVCILV